MIIKKERQQQQQVSLFPKPQLIITRDRANSELW
jgi:hypothetical protein